eukprot:m.98614 g.98614  ORF g.98614 m.98614 type:complete len:443 (+) comp12440_c0_seq1:3423-4751(+)
MATRYRDLSDISLAALVLASAVSSGCAWQSTESAPRGMWTWVGGSTTAISPSEPIPSDQPTGRCCAQSWTSAENLWVFGGAGILPGSSPDGEFLGDMWSFSTTSRTWTYYAAGGSRDPNPAGDSVTPSGRNYGITWLRTRPGQPDELWMWGGVGVRHSGDVNGGTLNDTWSFNTATHTWTKHSIPAGAVSPHGRNWANFWATHSGDVLWVQAGASVDYVPFGDMWSYSVSQNNWTRIYRHDTFPHWEGDKTNPGARSNSYTVVDGNDLVLFGGEGEMMNSSGIQGGDFQDVWRFTPENPTSGTWRYESGPAAVGCLAQYGTKGVPSKTNLPPAEHAGFVLREAFRGALWFLGGENGDEQDGMRNDLWSYNLTTKLWTWEAGDMGYNGTAVYGKLGLPAFDNTPGARYAGQAFTLGGKLWTFGGFSLDSEGGFGYMNDVWAFE